MTLRRVLTRITDVQTKDGCKCACSPNGCSVTTIMLKRILGIPRNVPRSEKLRRFAINCDIDPLIVIRFLTFERMEMTHTCCVREKFHGTLRSVRFIKFDDKNRIDIQEEESEYIELLEELVTEFEQVFHSSGNTLQDFLEGYWASRMDEIMTADTSSEEEEIKRTRELGVTWEPCERKKEPVTPRIKVLEEIASLQTKVLEKPASRDDEDLIGGSTNRTIPKRRNSC